MRHVVTAREVDAEIHRARSALLSVVARCPQRRIADVLEILETFMASARDRADHRGDADVMRRFYMDRLAARQAVGSLRLRDRRAGRRALDRYVAAEERRQGS
jgi:hypothetical protein